MTDTRTCEQCGSTFTPRREHARFCSARCRVAWNREHAGDRTAGTSALDWSLAAMRDATGRLRQVRPADRRRALAAVSEAVWWVTIVDATLVRYHPGSYDGVLAAQHAPGRRRTEGILAGLRFVRNQMGHQLDPADFIRPAAVRQLAPASDRVSDWTWTSLPAPAFTTIPPHGQEWELTRYRAYQAHLAGHLVGETFTQAAAFLNRTAAQAAAQTTGTSAARLHHPHEQHR